MQTHPGRAHNLLWLDFAVGTGALPRDVFSRRPSPEVAALIEFFLNLARSGQPEEVLAGLYVYESQVPRIAEQKAKALQTKYGLDAAACRYFAVHSTEDVVHASVWHRQLQEVLTEDLEASGRAFSAAKRTAKALWKALDGINAKRVG